MFKEREQHQYLDQTESIAGVAKAANGFCIFNRIMQPDGSGKDPPGVRAIEIDFCRHTGRQAQHLPSVGDCKQTPASSHEAGWAAFRTQPWVTVEDKRSEVIARMRCSLTELPDVLVSLCKGKSTAKCLDQHKNGEPHSKASVTSRRKAAKYKPLRHLKNTTRVGN